MKYILSLLCLSTALSASAQSFYDLDQIQDIRIYFSQNNWDYRMDTAKAGTESYLLADSVAINGEVFKNCGVKYKGNSSYDAGRAKTRCTSNWILKKTPTTKGSPTSNSAMAGATTP